MDPSDRDGENVGNDQIDITSDTKREARRRGSDRRSDLDLFGGYQGPERRSGRDRRDGA